MSVIFKGSLATFSLETGVVLLGLARNSRAQAHFQTFCVGARGLDETQFW